MTREELREHCERQIQQFERVKKIMPVTLNDWKRYEEHKLILELLEQEPKTGHWIENEKQTHVEKIYHCSECGFEAWGEWERTNYCGGCGARMSEVEQ